MSRLEQLAGVVNAAAEVMSLDELGAHILPGIKQAARASSALLYRYDDRGRLEALAGDIADVIDQYARLYWAFDPVQTVPRGLAPVPRVVLATREVDRRTHHRSAAYGEFYSAFDLEHLACIWLTHVPYGAPGMTGLLLTRPQRASDFDADDRRLLSRALPALSAATSRCRRFGALELQRAALDAIVAASTRRPCLVLSALGDLVWASPAATRLLSGTPCAAPDALRMAARRLCATTRSEPAPTTVRLQHHGASIVAELSMLRAEPPLVLVDIEGLAASSRAHDLARRFQLTAAEARVLEQLVAGLSNASIGAELGVSIETVRTHVRRILAKLGVESRVQAALLAARHIGG